jgi:hypothetical protein
MRNFMAYALAALFMVSFTGCKKVVNTAMSLEEFSEFCNNQYGYAEDCDSAPLCSDYVLALSQPYPDVKSCTQACNKLDAHLYMATVMTECANVVDGAVDWCEQYCHRKYGQKK